MRSLLALAMLGAASVHPAAAVFTPVDRSALKTAVDDCLKEPTGTFEDGTGICPLVSDRDDGNGGTYGAIGEWDVSQVEDMNKLFWWAEKFNQELPWNVGNVKNMKLMFQFAKAFNKDLSTWDVSKVTDMEGMFYSASSFDKDLSSWNVAKVTTMRQMFFYASSFNQALCGQTWLDSTADQSHMFGAAGGGSISNTPCGVEECITNNGLSVTGVECTCGGAICTDQQFCDAGTCHNTKRCDAEDASAATIGECRCGDVNCHNGEFCNAADESGTLSVCLYTSPCDTIQFDIKGHTGAAHAEDWATKVFYRTTDQSGGRDVWTAQYVTMYGQFTKYLTWRSCNDGRDGWYFLSQPTVTNCNDISWQMGSDEKVLSTVRDAQNIGTSAIRINNNAGGTITQTCFTPDDCNTNDGSTVAGEPCECGDATCTDSQFCDAGSCETIKRCVVEDASAAAGEDCRCGGSTCTTGQFCDSTQDGGACGPWAKGAASVADACALCAENPVEYVQAGVC